MPEGLSIGARKAHVVASGEQAGNGARARAD